MVNNKDFYSLFRTPVFFKVSSQGVKIGELPLSPQIKEDENVFLSAKIWKIKYVDYEASRIEVSPAKDGKKPLFFGDAADTAHRIREKMMEILYSDEAYDFLDQEGKQVLKEMREEFSVFPITDLTNERPLLFGSKQTRFYSFAGSKINKTICFLLDQAGTEYSHDDHSTVFISSTPEQEPFTNLAAIRLTEDQIKEALGEALKKNPALINLSKFGLYLPLKFQAEILKNKYYDFDACFKFLEKIRWVYNNNE